jgi:hypothetical protein
MTREHVPPKSAGNSDQFRRLEDPFDPQSAAAEVGEWKEGHTVSTLCDPCNKRASQWKYVAEYRRWFEHFVATARKIARERGGADPLLDNAPFEIELPYDAHPARFIRQVVGMILAIQSDHLSFASYPELSSLIGSDEIDPRKRRRDGIDISPVRIAMAVDNGVFAFLPTAAAITVKTPPQQQLWTPVSAQSSLDNFAMVRWSPFAFFITDGEPHPGLDVTDWTQWSVDRRPTRQERRLAVPTVAALPGIAAGMLRSSR